VVSVGEEEEGGGGGILPHTHGVELEPKEACLVDTFLDFVVEVHEMHVAWVTREPDLGYRQNRQLHNVEFF
jgi:hypothetical protein